MRQGSNSGRRPRGRTNRKQHGGGPSRPHTFDSNGPDGRVRGNARQVYEKYLTLARDASSAGDRVAAEAYYQHAEHYFRIMSDSTDPQPTGRRYDDRQPQPYPNDGFGSDDEAAAANGSVAPAAGEPAPARHNGAAAPEPAEARTGPDGEVPPGEPASAQEAQGEAAPRPRRGRPRKPRANDEDQARNQDPATEPESDSAPS